MRLHFEFIDQEASGFAVAVLEKIVRASIVRSRYDSFLHGKDVTVSVAFISADEMRRVNASTRDKNVVTDVLSFGDYSDDLDLLKVRENNIFLGEVLLCWDFIQKSATIHGVTASFEVGYVLSHGILHLLGYEHSAEMFALQASISEEYCAQLL